MKHRIVKGPRKPPKRVEKLGVVLCPCNIEDLPAWILHNIDGLATLFSLLVMKGVEQGRPFPPVEVFEDFCKEAHAKCRDTMAEIEAESATKH